MDVFASNSEHIFQGTKKTLVLREIPEDRVKKFLANKESLAACDVAVVVYDRLVQKLFALVVYR